MNAYQVELVPAEWSALEWIAARYTSAEVLTDHTDDVWGPDELEPDAVPVGHVIAFDADAARDYLVSLWEDNHYRGQVVPPCAGGTLAAKLTGLRDAIVEDLGDIVGIMADEYRAGIGHA